MLGLFGDHRQDACATLVGLKRCLEAIEEVSAIVGAGRGFGVVLHRERLGGLVANTRDRVVVEIAMSNLQAIRQRLFVDRESMVLRGDFDLAGF